MPVSSDLCIFYYFCDAGATRIDKHLIMRKITEIPVTRYRTVEEKDASGKRVRRKLPYTAARNVAVTSDGKRLLHHLIDVILIQLIASAFNFGFAMAMMPVVESSGEKLQVAISLFTFNWVFFTVIGAYYILFEHFLGKTPGKLITRTRVINIYGKKPGIDTLMIRTLARFIPFEAFSCIGGRSWHDRFSETFVVDDAEAAAITKLLEENEEPHKAIV